MKVLFVSECCWVVFFLFMLFYVYVIMKNCLFFLGFFGVGKGIQVVWLCDVNSMKYLFIGDLLCFEVVVGSDLGKEVEVVMNCGELVSDVFVLVIVESQMKVFIIDGWLLDGFFCMVFQVEVLEFLLVELQ